MDYGLSLIERDVTAHSNHFMLTVDRNFLVHFALRIKRTQRCSIDRSNGGKMGTGNVILLRKLEQSGKRLISLVEDNGVLFRWFSRVQQLDLHPRSFPLRTGRDSFQHHVFLITSFNGERIASLLVVPKIPMRSSPSTKHNIVGMHRMPYHNPRFGL